MYVYLAWEAGAWFIKKELKAVPAAQRSFDSAT
jgi:hypothetical protein